MNRTEVIDLLERIDALYPNRFKPTDLGITIAEWSEALADEDLETVNRNLAKYIKANDWPPNIANLLGVDGGTRTQVKNVKETAEFLQQYENRPPADPKVVAEERAKIRRLLGLDGEGDE